MPSRWATLSNFAGIDFSTCRVIIIDNDQFASNYKGSVEWGNDGNALAQIINAGKLGNVFGIQMDSAEITKVNQVRTAVEATQITGGKFRVTFTDDLYGAIDIWAIRDYSQKWFSFQKMSEGWLEGVLFRLVSQGTYS